MCKTFVYSTPLERRLGITGQKVKVHRRPFNKTHTGTLNKRSIGVKDINANNLFTFANIGLSFVPGMTLPMCCFVLIFMLQEIFSSLEMSVMSKEPFSKCFVGRAQQFQFPLPLKCLAGLLPS